MNWRGKDRLLAISTPPPKMKNKNIYIASECLAVPAGSEIVLKKLYVCFLFSLINMQIDRLIM